MHARIIGCAGNGPTIGSKRYQMDGWMNHRLDQDHYCIDDSQMLLGTDRKSTSHSTLSSHLQQLLQTTSADLKHSNERFPDTFCGLTDSCEKWRLHLLLLVNSACWTFQNSMCCQNRLFCFPLHPTNTPLYCGIIPCLQEHSTSAGTRLSFPCFTCQWQPHSAFQLCAFSPSCC